MVDPVFVRVITAAIIITAALDADARCERDPFEHAVARRSDQLVAVDFADRADRRDLWLRQVQQRRQLRQTVQDLLQRLFVGEVERELQLHVGQAVQRNGADGVEVGERRRLRLDRNGDVALDLLRRQPGLCVTMSTIGGVGSG